jgi:hypothetical protein
LSWARNIEKKTNKKNERTYNRENIIIPGSWKVYRKMRMCIDYNGLSKFMCELTMKIGRLRFSWPYQSLPTLAKPFEGRKLTLATQFSHVTLNKLMYTIYRIWPFKMSFYNIHLVKYYVIQTNIAFVFWFTLFKAFSGKMYKLIPEFF